MRSRITSANSVRLCSPGICSGCQQAFFRKPPTASPTTAPTGGKPAFLPKSPTPAILAPESGTAELTDSGAPELQTNLIHNLPAAPQTSLAAPIWEGDTIIILDGSSGFAAGDEIRIGTEENKIVSIFELAAPNVSSLLQQKGSFSTETETGAELERPANESHGTGVVVTKKQTPLLELGGALVAENNLGGLTADGNGFGAMYFQGAIVFPDADLRVTNLTEYLPWKSSINGKVSNVSDLAQVSLPCGHSVSLLFQFLSRTSFEEVTLSKINFTIADLDHGIDGRCRESVEVAEDALYMLTPDSTISVTKDSTDDRFRRFSAGEAGTREDNPVVLANFSELQERKSVVFQLTNTENFVVIFSTTPDVTGDSDDLVDPSVDGYAGRRIIFGGTLA